MHLVQHTMYLV